MGDYTDCKKQKRSRMRSLVIDDINLITDTFQAIAETWYQSKYRSLHT